MTAPLWQLDRRRARLRLAQLEGTIDLSRPGEGLRAVCVDRKRVEGAGLLGMSIPSFPAGDAESIAECYVRGTDLVAVYRESPDWPVRVQSRWRAGSRSTPQGLLSTVELAVSVHTRVGDSEPGLSVRSALPTEAVWRLVDESGARFELLDGEGPFRISPDGGPGCLVFRLAGSTRRYVEMVPPGDFVEGRLQVGGESEARILLQRLFAGRLEKGVILRARVCGAFLPGDGDLPDAAACYASFAAAELPLGT